jgi:hypothetical protein
MGAYEGKFKAELQSLASSRGLSASGTNEDLVARLEEWDTEHADDLLSEIESGSTPKAAATAPPAPAATAPAAAAPPAPPADPYAVKSPPGAYRTRFEVGTELSTGMHQEYQQRTFARAVEAGHIPRGGMAGARRVEFINEGGTRYAIYEQVIRKPQE